LPPGYTLIKVPSDATFEDDSLKSDTSLPRTKLSCNYNFVKVLIALGQTLFAITTLYRTKGDQINRFGYAAFGLTVAPYAFMSVVNLFGHLMCPDYSKMYLVESEGLRQLREELNEPQGYPIRDSRRNIVVEGVVGKLTLQADRHAQEHGITDSTRILVAYLSFFLALTVSLAIIGGLSKFRGGTSTHAQRVWTMSWLAFGIFAGFSEAIGNSMEDDYSEHFGMLIVMCSSYSAPAIGGFVVVGQMISRYGVCYRIS
jgi:hypothetical protein